MTVAMQQASGIAEHPIEKEPERVLDEVGISAISLGPQSRRPAGIHTRMRRNVEQLKSVNSRKLRSTES